MNYVEVAIKAAREAGAILKERLGNIKRVDYKAKNSLVTEVDELSENYIIGIIKSNFPSHDIFAEESGRNAKDSSYLWLIDPLDGTTNFAHSYPVFSVSIALEIQGVVKMGVVYDPLRDELFTAELGKGAFVNEKAISVSGVGTVEESLLCTGFTHENQWMVDENLRHFENFIQRAQAVRRDGSAALDLCYVACGRYDGFWELGLNPWDTAAGALILKEAGGKATDFVGNDYNIYYPEILANNGQVHQEMMSVLSMELGKRRQTK